MGCFDLTCCLSGLAIHNEDKVKFGLVSRKNTWPFYSSYACGNYGFWTMLFSGVYNDYGSVYQEKISNKPFWNWMFSRILPYIKPKKDSICKEKYETPTDLGRLIDDLIRHRVIIQPLTNIEHNVDIWICHEWAYKAVLKRFSEPSVYELTIIDSIKKEVDLYVHLCKEKQWQYLSQCNFIFVDGTMGFIQTDFRQIFTESNQEKTFDDFENDFREALLESCKFITNLFHFRKGILPNQFSGEQYESNHELSGWTKLVAKEAQKQFKKWNV